MAQEGLHSMKNQNLKGAILKIDLSKAYDKVSWTYIHMLLIHLGFGIAFVRWILCCVTTVSFSVLINGAASSFFHVERGPRQGCPLSPLLFLLVTEGLIHLLLEAHRGGRLNDIDISQN